MGCKGCGKKGANKPSSVKGKSKYNILNVIVDYVKGDLKESPLTLAQERFEICSSCPELLRPGYLCGDCFCLVRLKVKVENEACGLGKW